VLGADAIFFLNVFDQLLVEAATMDLKDTDSQQSNTDPESSL
jgi:hypothetical protein